MISPVAIGLLFQIQPRLKNAAGVAGQLSCCSAHHTFSCLLDSLKD